MKKRTLGCLGVIVLLPIVFVAVLMMAIASDSESSCDSNSSVNIQSATISSIASNTDPFTKGTVAYNNAYKVFKAFVDHGATGSFSSGIVGWVNSEGGFVMLGRAEGHYGNDLLTNSIAYGVEPLVSGTGYSTGGGGVFQFTPYTKYANLGSPDWENADKMIAFVIKSIASGDWNASMDLTGGNHSLEQAFQMTDPQQAALTWQAYERGDTAYINQNQKKSDAQKFYDLFGGGSYSFNATKFNEAFGSTSSEISSSSSGSSSSDYSNCSSSSSGGAWGDDGTGSVKYSAYNAWKSDDLPIDLKKYAIDPKSVGLGYKSSTGWNAIASTGGQCTDLSASLMSAIWIKDDNHPNQRMGNGDAVVSNWVSSFGGSASSKPSAGSVFSETASLAGNSAGHTGVVSHVFENGDMLVVEQNYSSLSGEDGGFGKYTWSYRYVTTSEIGKGYTFYSPSQSGYKIVESVKTIG